MGTSPTTGKRPPRRHIGLAAKIEACLLRLKFAPDDAKLMTVYVIGSKFGRSFLEACLRALGLDPNEVQWDHSPPLALRDYDDATQRYTPDELDPAHLYPMPTHDKVNPETGETMIGHRTKTSGTPKGQKVVHVADGDQHKIAKADRIRDNLQARAEGIPPRKRHRWGTRKLQSRGFAKRVKA
jgi:hypothetical protein